MVKRKGTERQITIYKTCT